MEDIYMQRFISVNTGNLLLSLSEITDIANPNIQAHQQRTAFIAMEIASMSGVDSDVLEDIFAAALLHDVGAISIEEKNELHALKMAESSYRNLDTHCIKGELLLKQTPWFNHIAKMVRYHHTDWKDMKFPIEDTDAFGAQIIYLSDLVERLIDRNVYILHQHEKIIDIVKNLGSHIIHQKVVDLFLEVARKEEFWLDIVSPRLYHVLLHNGPFRNEMIGLDDIKHISKMYKDVIDFKSPYTATHTTGVEACANILSENFGFTSFEIQLMSIAANLHDIGKLAIPNKILEKKGKLTKEEFAVIKSHTYYTYYVINTIGGLERIADMAAYHHEKLNGEGYPFKCKSHEIGIGARIMTVSDIFTAITEDRPYRKGMDKNGVYSVFKSCIDKKEVDKRIVELLFDDYEKLEFNVKNKQSMAKDFYENRFLTYTGQIY
jgi:HD-GYP domain-containing protein (c-di-GMP phosphodiesterase class II)